VTGQWFSLGTPVSSTDIAEILLKVALNTINQTKPSKQTMASMICFDSNRKNLMDSFKQKTFIVVYWN
jgi:hypothetical protein